MNVIVIIFFKVESEIKGMNFYILNRLLVYFIKQITLSIFRGNWNISVGCGTLEKDRSTSMDFSHFFGGIDSVSRFKNCLKIDICGGRYQNNNKVITYQ